MFYSDNEEGELNEDLIKEGASDGDGDEDGVEEKETEEEGDKWE